MAQRRSQAGMFPGAYGGFSRIGEQEMYDPVWTNIDFADFQGLDMNMINQNAQFAQEVANKRMENILQEQKAILEKVALHKRDADLQSQLENKLSSIIDNMGNLQLSDMANYTSLNTNLMKAKNDPVLLNAVKSSEDAKAYEKLKLSNPSIETQPWNNENEAAYQRWLRGETNEFTLSPVYKEYDLQTKSDEFAKDLPPDVKEYIQNYGMYGLQEKAVEDKTAGKVYNALQIFKQGLMQDPEFQSWYKRRGSFESAQGNSIDNVIDNMFKSSATRFGTTEPKIKVGMPQTNPDIRTRIDLDENARAQARFEAEKAAGFTSGTGSGGGTGSGNQTNVGTPYIDYDGQQIFKPNTKGQLVAIKPTDKKNYLDNLLAKAKTTTGRNPVLFLSDGTEDKFKGSEGPERYNIDFKTTGRFIPDNENPTNVLVEVATKGGPARYVKVHKSYLESQLGAGNTAPIPAISPEAQKLRDQYAPKK